MTVWQPWQLTYKLRRAGHEQAYMQQCASDVREQYAPLAADWHHTLRVGFSRESKNAESHLEAALTHCTAVASLAGVASVGVGPTGPLLGALTLPTAWLGQKGLAEGLYADEAVPVPFAGSAADPIVWSFPV